MTVLFLVVNGVSCVFAWKRSLAISKEFSSRKSSSNLPPDLALTLVERRGGVDCVG